MHYLLEIILLVYIFYRSKKILSNTICQNISGVIGVLAAATGSSLALYLLLKLMPRIADNLFLQCIIAIVIAILVFAAIWAMLPGRCLSFLEKKAGIITSLTPSSRLLEKSANTIFLLCFLLWMFIIIEVLVQLGSLSGQQKQIAQTPDRQEVILRTMEAQQRFLRNLHYGFRKTKELVAEKSGINAIREHIEIVKKLSQLSEEENIWLIQTSPALQKLANNPSLLAVIEDEQLMTLIMEASQGSLTALYRLGEEPLIKNLFDDEEFVESIRQIRLKELFQKVKYRFFSPPTNTF